MMASKSRNLLTVLDMLQAVYRGSAGLPPSIAQDEIRQRADDLAAAVRFCLDNPDTLPFLRDLARDLRDAPRIEALLPRVLDGAMALTGADMGTIRLLDPVSGSLWLITQSGFGAEFLDEVTVVDSADSWWLREALGGAQAVIADVNADAGFASYRDIAAASGCRAVLCTPLSDDAGHVIGAVSTHFTRPCQPSAADLEIMALYGIFAGQAVARHLGRAAGDGQGGAMSRAVVAALLDPGDRQELSPAAPSGPHRRANGSWNEAPPATDMFALADYVVNRLFAVGLSLESARSIIGPGPSGDRIASATAEVDGLIAYIRTGITFGLAADREHGAPDQGFLMVGEREGRGGELLDRVASSFAEISLLPQDPADPPSDVARTDIVQALSRLDVLASEVRDDVSAARDLHGTALLQARIARAARRLQEAAADAAALLEQRGDIVPFGRVDYKTEVKRWRAFADQAEEMAERWGQAP